MLREIDLNDISDGKLYTENDMAKLGCNDCRGCSACCTNMGNSIILDPYDVFRIRKELDISIADLLSNQLELNVVDGIILPNLKMGLNNKCSFLNDFGRCRIHQARPSICRLFPLGRFYENNDFKYFLQVNECKKDSRTKVKISKWIAVDNIKKNHNFINMWHYFQKDVQAIINSSSDDGLIKQINMYILNQFFLSEYDLKEDFYIQFEEKMQKARKDLGLQ